MSLPLLLFFWVGAQSFVRPAEKKLAVAILGFAAGLLALSLATLFLPWLAWVDLVAIVAAAIVYVALWLYGRPRQ